MLDVIDIVTKIRNQGVSVFLIGSAVLMLIVTLSAFQWLKETVDAKKKLKKQRERERKNRIRRFHKVAGDLYGNTSKNLSPARRKRLADEYFGFINSRGYK